jgi:O-acetyl-ADP-ribose deacetylase
MNKNLIDKYLTKHHKNETFQELLFKLIKISNMEEVDIYKAANMDRKLFSKIRSNKEYTPSKKNVIALALALKLDSKTSKNLIKRAGYILTSGYKFDLIIRYCIENQIHDLNVVNDILYDHGLPLIGVE